ncbi:MAG TPA: hypothetical protein VJV78_33835 [Polyangiales bacterium]|nr:hypothetical protein [Polyangiales bacterium]
MSNRRYLLPCCSALLALGLARPVVADDAASATTLSAHVAAGAWATAQLIPSPLLVVGAGHVGGGMRWQLTPLLYSFGIAARPFRSFVIAPIARHSGSVELHFSPEWACCAPDGDSGWLARAGLRVYLPLLEHGEVLSWSVGASGYYAADGFGPAGDLGIYTLFGVLGLTVTVSPLLSRREVIAALNIRYF